jgi:hypothetical protein
LPFARVNLAAEWRADVQAAKVELEATEAQAFVLASHALAWRLTRFVLPCVLAVAAVLVVRGDARPAALLLAGAIGILVPQALAFLLTFPVNCVATSQTWRRGSQTAQVRFGVTGFVYNYYGWRYAYRGRQRPWGAMTRQEQAFSNPTRAGVPPTGGA